MTRFRARACALLLVAAGAVLAAGCGSSDDSSAKAAATSVPPTAVAGGAAKITTFEVPTSVDCNGKTNVDVTLNYALTSAKQMQINVDGRPYKLNDAQGSQVVNVHCDALPHTMVMIAYDDKGRRTAEQKLLTTNL